MRYKIIYTAVLAVLTFQLTAQKKINFEEALSLTLENNYDIRIASVNEEIAVNNASSANNNYLPTVEGIGDVNWNYLEGENRLITRDQTFDANSAYNYSAAIIARYTLFDGRGRRYNFLQSKENLRFTQLQLELIVQNTILELSRVYHEVARLEENVEFLERSVSVSKDRLQRAEYSYEYGQVNKLEVLNATVDLNADSIALITGLQQLENLKRNLNFIMGQEVDQEIIVDNQVDIQQNIQKEDVLNSTQERNIDLKLAKSSLQINQLAIGSAKSNWMPNLNANAGYYYNGTENPNGAFVIGSNNFGPQAGLSLSWTLFNGRNNVAVKNAKLNLKSQEIEQESIQQNVLSQALNAYTSYKNLLFILRSQEDNVKTAQDNFQRSENSYQLGQINSIDFRLAQLNLLNTAQALIQAKYDAKNAELELLAIMGALLEE